MMAQAASRLGVHMTVVDPGGLESPAGAVCGRAIKGAFTDPSKIRELSKLVDVITVEIEHVETAVLAELEAEGIQVHPSAATIALIQDKYAQKQHLAAKCAASVPLGEFCDIPDVAALRAAGDRWGYPLMLKCRRDAYDGRGNLPVNAAEEAASAFATLSNGGKAALYAEKWCPFAKELAVMVVRSVGGATASYPTVETIQRESMMHHLIAPAVVTPEVLATAGAIASAAVASLSGGGIFGVELFLMPDGAVLLNEIAPRPHNSGHYTMDACHVDQFENHLRAVLDLPLGSVEMKVRGPLPKYEAHDHRERAPFLWSGPRQPLSVPSPLMWMHMHAARTQVPNAAMLNVIGDGSLSSTLAPIVRGLTLPGASIHWYGKDPPKVKRKMGHVNVTASTAAGVMEALATLQGLGAPPAPPPLVGIIMGSDSDLPCMKVATRPRPRARARARSHACGHGMRTWHADSHAHSWTLPPTSCERRPRVNVDLL